MSETDGRAESCARLLLDAAREAGFFVSGDQRIAEGDAAQLLGLNVGSMRNMRTEGTGPVAYRTALNGSRVSYRLQDIAMWVEASREAW